MSNLIVVLGESGTGKSTSIRNLNPKETFIINVLNKPLPFKGYKKQYNIENKNLLESDKYSEIIAYLTAINERRPDIKTIIIDDFSFLMNNEFMRRCREKDWSKFNDMAFNIFSVLETCRYFRDDLYCFFMCHTEKDHAGFIKPKTIGKMTDDHVGISERLIAVFHTQIIDRQYKFLTNTDGVHMAKSPIDMFQDLFIDNDLNLVIEGIKKYYEE